MSIQVQCTSCGKVYAADDSFAGRRIRCRACGTTFTIPAAEGSQEESENDLSALAGPQESSPNEATYSGHHSGSSSESDSEDSREYVPSGRYRPRLNYPYAVVVDRWLPILLLIGGLASVIFAAIRYDETNRPALIVSRILVLILAYLIVVFPMAAKGIQMASRDLGFQLPRAKYSRTLVSFMPAFALGSVLWMAGGMTGLALGVIVGLIVSTLAMWLLFHMHPSELPATAGYAGGMMLFGIAIVGGALFGMNLLLSSAMVSMHKIDTFPGSPFGMAFTWPKPPEPVPAPRKPQIVEKPTPAPQQPTSPSPVTQPTAVVEVPPAQANPDHPADSTAPATQNSGGMFADATKDNDNTPNPPPPPDSAHPPVIAPPHTTSPLVSSVALAPTQNPFDEIIRPATPSSWAVLLHKGTGRGEIDRVWIGPGDGPNGTKPWTTDGSTPFVSDPKGGDRYALSPDGDSLAHIASFPSLSVNVYSFSTKTSQNIKLQESFGTAELVGFVSPTRFLVRREKNSVGCELFDIRANVPRVRDFNTEKFSCGGVTTAISPDGSMLAIASLDIQRDNQRPANSMPTIFLYDLLTGAPRKLPVSDLAGGPVTSPTGMAFSSDGARIAALYEQNPNGLLLIFKTKGQIKPVISQQLAPVPTQPDNGYIGSSLIWVGEDAICLYGKFLISGSTGASIGDLGITNVSSQRFTIPDLLELGWVASTGDHQIAMVKLKMDQLPHP